MARLVSNVDITTETWGQLIVRTNTLLDALSYEIVTANNSMAYTGNSSVNRNSSLYGSFGANNIYVATTLSGGFANSLNQFQKDTLRISSNVEIGAGADRLDSRANSLYTNTQFWTANLSGNGAVFTINPLANNDARATELTVNTNTITIRGGNLVVKSNTSINALTITNDGITTNTNVTGNNWVSSANLVVTSLNHTIAGNTNFDSGTMFVDGTNNRVGLGTTTPDATLKIVGTSNTTSNVWIGGTTTTVGNVSLSSAIMTVNTNGTANTVTIAGANVNVDAGTLFVDQINNRVGVNSTAPNASLAVVGTANVSANVTFDGGTFFLDATTNKVGFNTLTPDANVSIVGTANVSGNTWIGANTTIAGTNHTIAGNVNFDTATMFVDSVNDRIGVGTSTPNAKIQVNGTANVQNATWIGGNVNFTTGIMTINATGTANTLTVTAANVNIDSGVLFVDHINNRVGVNNTAPDASVTVTGTANISANTWIGGTANVVGNVNVQGISHTIAGNTNFDTGTMFVDSVNDRVGIGTTTPDAKLNVVGTANVSSDVRIGGNTTIVGNTSIQGSDHAIAGNTNFDTGTMFVDSVNDRVGLGTTTPDARLSIVGGANVSVDLRVGGNTTIVGNVVVSGTGHTIAGNTNFDAGTLFVDGINNRVGVNNTAPDAALKITGTANITANTWIGGTAGIVGNVAIQGISHTIAGNVNFDSGTVFIDSVNNRIGLGTNAPNATIQVVGAANVSSALYVGGNGAIVGNVTISGTTHTVAGNTNFDTNTLMVDGVNDRVGVGTATPDTKLQVAGAANVQNAIYVGGNANFTSGILTVNATAGNANTVTIAGANVNVDSGTLFVDQVNNRIGVNNTSPTASLTVTGTANVSGNTWIGGVTTVSGNVVVGGTSALNGAVTIEQDYFIDVLTNSNIGNTQSSRVIYTFPKATYRSGKLMVFANNTNGTAQVNQIAEMVVAHDGDLAAYVSVYGVVASPANELSTAAPLGTFSAQINSTSNNVEILMNQIYSNSAVKVVAHLIK